MHASNATAERGTVIRSRASTDPGELDLRATIHHALRETGLPQPRLADLHERVREPKAGTRFLFVIDSSGSHAASQRMREVKGAVIGLLTQSFRRGDEVAIIVFRGTAAELILEPSATLADAVSALEYLPTGGRTPLAHGLDLARSCITAHTVLILMTDGRANYALHGGDPWQEALEAAASIHCTALVVDTESAANRLGQAGLLAQALHARCLTLEELLTLESLPFEFYPASD